MKMRGTLLLENIAKTFQGQGGVRDLSFAVPQGQGFSLLGPSGCGKSTTLRLIGGFEAPDQGKIFHGDREISKLPPQKRDIRTVFQRYALFPHLNVAENVAFGLRMQRMAEAEISKKSEWAMDLLEIRAFAARPVARLSGGEQQRVALARALVTEPSVLLLDEPLSALDLKLRERMQLELLALRHKLGSTFVFVTHDQSEAMSLSDTIAVMNAGRIMQVGSPEEIYHRPHSRFVAEFIGQANFLSPSKRALMKGSLETLPAVGANQQWMLRPEHFTARPLAWVPPPGFVSINARVQENAFLGPERITKAVDAEGSAFLLKTPGFEPFAGNPGQEIQLSWETEDTWTVASS